MTNMTAGEEVLKTDTLGRVHTPKARREALLEEFERSGVSGQKFAAMVGVNYQTFAAWVQRRRKARGSQSALAPTGGRRPSEALRLVEAVIREECVPEGSADEVSICVQLPGGAEIKVHDVRQVMLVAELLRALVARVC
jgi:transposase